MAKRSRLIIVTSVVLGALAVGTGVFAWSGIYNIAADDAHTRPVYLMLQMLRERSVTARARKLHPPPNLDDAALIRQGAGNYDAMCTGCHLAPGMGPTELSSGLYPSPPDFSKAKVGDPSHHFWAIKHGFKASGMPAWGKSMSDEYIWGMVAFLQRLPTLDAAQYQALVDASGGHSHGGGESGEHHHEEGEPEHPHEEGAAPCHAMDGMHTKGAEPDAHAHAGSPAAEGITHTHADGTRHVHAAPQAATARAPAGPATEAPAEHADDGHLH